MDRLDILILRELAQGGELWPARPGSIPSYRQLARKVQASPGTVRNRVRRMIQSGFMHGVLFYPNPTLLGFLGGSYAIELPHPEEKPRILARVAAVDGVIFLENFRGALLGIGLTYADDRALEPTLRRIDRAAGTGPGMFTPVAHPPCPASLSRPDWQLAVRLMAGGLPSYSHAAGDLGVSLRTLKRRMKRLMASGALLSFPRLDYRALHSGVTAELLVAFDGAEREEEAKARISAHIGDFTFFTGAWDRFRIYRLILPNIARATTLGEAVRRIPGLAFARMELVDSLEYHLDALLPHARRRLEALTGEPGTKFSAPRRA